MSHLDVPSVPQHLGTEGCHVSRAQLLDLRARAVQAVTEAEEKEKDARAARRVANALLRQYEQRVEEYNGQLVLPEE